MTADNDWEFKVEDPSKGKVTKRESLIDTAQKKKVRERKLRLDHKKPMRRPRSSYVEEEKGDDETPIGKIKSGLRGNIQLILFLVVIGVIAYFALPLINQ